MTAHLPNITEISWDPCISEASCTPPSLPPAVSAHKKERNPKPQRGIPLGT